MNLWIHHPTEVLAALIEIANLPDPVDPWAGAPLPILWQRRPVEDFTRTQLLPVVGLPRG